MSETTSTKWQSRTLTQAFGHQNLFISIQPGLTVNLTYTHKLYTLKNQSSAILKTDTFSVCFVGIQMALIFFLFIFMAR